MTRAPVACIFHSIGHDDHPSQACFSLCVKTAEAFSVLFKNACVMFMETGRVYKFEPTTTANVLYTHLHVTEQYNFCFLILFMFQLIFIPNSLCQLVQYFAASYHATA
jgi:hypothetical protein